MRRPVEPRIALEIFTREILPVLHVFGIGDEIVTTKALLNEIGIFASAESTAAADGRRVRPSRPAADRV